MGITSDIIDKPVITSSTSVSKLNRNENKNSILDDRNPINYPNPFHSSTTILYIIPVSGNVTISIFDLLGQKIYVHDEGFKISGETQIRLELNFLNSGVYFYEIKIDGRRQAFNKITVIK